MRTAALSCWEAYTVLSPAHASAVKVVFELQYDLVHWVKQDLLCSKEGWGPGSRHTLTSSSSFLPTAISTQLARTAPTIRAFTAKACL